MKYVNSKDDSSAPAHKRKSSSHSYNSINPIIGESTSLTSSNFMENLVYSVKMNANVCFYNQDMFREITQLCNIDEAALIRSLHPMMNREQIFKTNKNRNTNDGGRSGSFFFFTQDQQFLVKTMTTTERKTLLQMLPNYVKHLRQLKSQNQSSLIAPILGTFRVKL